MLTSWKKHTSIYRPLTHYVNVQGTNWNAKIMQQSISGTNQNSTPLTKQIYSIEISDGYRTIKLDFYSVGLKQSKIKAEKMLLDCFTNVSKAA